MSSDKLGFVQTYKALTDKKKTIPKILANHALNFFMKSFDKGGFTDREFEAWEEVERRIPGTKAFEYPKKKKLSRRTSPILVRTGNLRKAVSGSLKSATWSSIRFSVDTPYGEYHNDPEDGKIKRQFIGESAKLMDELQTKMIEEIEKIWPKK